MPKYQLICMSFEGDYIIEHDHFNPDGFESVKDAWEHAEDMGSKWFFYPFYFVTSESGKTIIDSPELLERFNRCKVKTVSKIFKDASLLSDNQGVDCETFIFNSLV
jgi:hypothetical protein